MNLALGKEVPRRRLEAELDETISTIEDLNNERLNIIEQA